MCDSRESCIRTRELRVFAHTNWQGDARPSPHISGSKHAAVGDLQQSNIESGVFRVPAEFSIRDGREAQAVLRDAASGETRVEWVDGSGRGHGHLAVEDDRVSLRADGALPRGTTNLSFVLHGVPLFVRCDLDGARVLEPLAVWSTEHRASTRAALETSAYLEWFSTDGVAFHLHRAPLLDFGATGARSLHAHGTRVPGPDVFAATLCVNGNAIHCMVEVRSRRSSERGEELGLRFLSSDSSDISELVMNQLFPRLVPRRSVPSDRLVELFDKSGYLKLRDGCRPSDAWLSLHADALSRDLVYVADNGDAVGHSSITRAYRRTWLAHQTAMLSQHADAVEARAHLLLGLTMLASLLDGPDAHVIAYYDRSKPYGRIFFEEFAQSVSSAAASGVTTFDRFERDTAPLNLGFDVPEHASVDFAKESELALVATLVRSHLPRLFADVTDIEPALLRRRSLHPAYEGSHLERGREVLALHVHGVLVGVALCEYTTRDLTLFNTMNLAQIYLVGGGVEDGAQRLLQHCVRTFYAARGIADPLVVASPGSFRADLDPHVRLVETMGAITWSFEGLRAYENYLRLRFAWLRQGRRPRPRARRPNAAH